MNRDQLLDDPEQQKKGIWGREDMSGEIKGKDGSVTTYNPIHPQEEQRIKGTSVLVKRETRDRDPIPEKMSTNRTPLYANSPMLPDQEQKPKAGALRKEEDHKGNDHVVSKESPKTINGRREDMGSTVEWGGGNIIAPNKRGGQPAESSHVEQKDFMSSNGTSGTKAPNQIDVHADLSKEQHINNFQLGRENSTHDHKINDMATSNSDLHSSDTNYIPIGIPIAENGDKGYEQQSRDHVSVTVSVKPDKVTTTITVKGHDERHESDEQNEGMTRNTTSSFQPPCPESPQYPNTDQNKNNKINDVPQKNPVAVNVAKSTAT
ncbi:hypothetical protein I3843_03G129400 [Carya illinoinensis]|uniref:uncharacterized protein LOC122303792 isoform X2 n=1 Tax=Carya illinoinensis TaxID=32201 RepID=UPI001C728B64|nr:uncharacterized protein LOC122303792 isoform X2 [Carya illinoinensis]KAG7987349.1 hypothetical protein I3843_03G129400 [Carya illinoinensis]